MANKAIINNMLDRATLVIPTHNRYHYLLRILSYYIYNKFPISILVLDSSTEKIQNNKLMDLLSNNRIYYHKVECDVLEKIAKGLELVSTEFCVFCADDDFIIPNGLAEAIQLLIENQDYSCAHGYYLSFKINKSQSGQQSIAWTIGNARSIEEDSAHERLADHLGDYQATFYAVHRTKQLQLFFNEVIKLQCDYRFGEIVPTALTAIYGKIKVIDTLYSCREISVCSTSQADTWSWRNILIDRKFHDKFSVIVDCLASHMISHSSLEKSAALKTIRYVFTRYLIATVGKHYFFRVEHSIYNKVFSIVKMILVRFRLYEVIKKIIIKADNKSSPVSIPAKNIQLLESLTSPQSQFYPDFIRIENILTRQADIIKQ